MIRATLRGHRSSLDEGPRPHPEKDADRGSGKPPEVTRGRCSGELKREPEELRGGGLLVDRVHRAGVQQTIIPGQVLTLELRAPADAYRLGGPQTVFLRDGTSACLVEGALTREGGKMKLSGQAMPRTPPADTAPIHLRTPSVSGPFKVPIDALKPCSLSLADGTAVRLAEGEMLVPQTIIEARLPDRQSLRLAIAARPVDEGGQGSVYSAIAAESGEGYAVKRLPGSRDASPERAALNEMEAASTAQAQAAPFVGIKNSEDGSITLLMRPAGTSVAKLLPALAEQGPKLRCVMARLLLHKLAGDLKAMHARLQPRPDDASGPELPCVHNDIKPANIFYEARDGVLSVGLGDFGAAADADDGTWEYWPPEGPADPSMDPTKRDIWALAVTALQVATGAYPFADFMPDGPLGGIAARQQALIAWHAGVHAPGLPASVATLPERLNGMLGAIAKTDPKLANVLFAMLNPAADRRPAAKTIVGATRLTAIGEKVVYDFLQQHRPTAQRMEREFSDLSEAVFLLDRGAR